MRAIIYLLFFILLISYSSAVPGIPCDFYGSVTINNEEAPKGTVVEAYINGVKYGSFTVKIPGKYGLMSVAGDDTETAEKDGGVDGDTVTFRVNGKSVSQTGEWEMGKSVRVDLELKTTTKEAVSSSNAETSEQKKITEDKNITNNRDSADKEEKTENKSEKEVSKGNVNTPMTESETGSGNNTASDESSTHKSSTLNYWIYGSIILLFIIIYFIIKKRGLK